MSAWVDFVFLIPIVSQIDSKLQLQTLKRLSKLTPRNIFTQRLANGLRWLEEEKFYRQKVFGFQAFNLRRSFP